MLLLSVATAKPAHCGKPSFTDLWVQLFYPKQTDKPLYKGLVTQLKSLDIPMTSIDDVKLKPLQEQYDIVVDSIFGFGFTGAPRPPFDKIIEVCCYTQAALSKHVLHLSTE